MLKSQSFTMRIKPEIKVALNELAARDGRTASAWIEAVVREQSMKLGIKVPSPASMQHDNTQKTP